MSNTIIKVENLSKKYQIGSRESYYSLRDKISDVFSFKNKEIRDKGEFWALKDVNFEVKQGESIGIIGRNGAGKSTLLKVLSQITPPTTGKITMKGRVASLLEVGTGFNPELTGRENIFLNGAILGMTREEIKRKFDEIVAFAEIEKFLDTPVKRYSSGMYMRLAFSVAAYLESEILIVDEVLAVGDAQFQKKCLGKMNDVTKNEGRTVLFVSHNMGAVSQLCTKAIFLKNSTIEYYGKTTNTIQKYLETSSRTISHNEFSGSLKEKIRINKISINNLTSDVLIKNGENLEIEIFGECITDIADFKLTLSLFFQETRLFSVHDTDKPKYLAKGKFKSCFILSTEIFRPGEYQVAIGGYSDLHGDWFFGTDLAGFQIAEVWNKNNIKDNIGLINVNCTSFRKI